MRRTTLAYSRVGRHLGVDLQAFQQHLIFILYRMRKHLCREEFELIFFTSLTLAHEMIVFCLYKERIELQINNN